MDRWILLSWRFPHQRLPRELPEYSGAHRKTWFCTYWPCYNKNAIWCNSENIKGIICVGFLSKNIFLYYSIIRLINYWRTVVYSFHVLQELLFLFPATILHAAANRLIISNKIFELISFQSVKVSQKFWRLQEGKTSLQI